MAWLGKVSLGGFPDLAGAVNKLSESVKNIEKNFDSALGLEEKSDSGESSGLWSSSSDRKALFDPVMVFMGHKGGESSVEHSENAESSQHIPSRKELDGVTSSELTLSAQEQQSTEEKFDAPKSQEEDLHSDTVETSSAKLREPGEAEPDSHSLTVGTEPSIAEDLEKRDSDSLVQEKDGTDPGFIEEAQLRESVPRDLNKSEQADTSVLMHSESHSIGEMDGNQDQLKVDVEQLAEEGFLEHVDTVDNREANIEQRFSDANATPIVEENAAKLLSGSQSDVTSSEQTQVMASEPIAIENELQKEPIKGNAEVIDIETVKVEQGLSSGNSVHNMVDTEAELERLQLEMKMMEAALQGAARQAQSKADEIAQLMNENEHLKSKIEELKRKSGESDSDALREEYHQRVASLERKAYALTKERDALRREQSKKSDATALLKEKDEIISQVMAEGEELSKKQAAQESQIRKLRAQIREFEEEKQRLNSKIQVEETKVESIKRDKAATEKLLQETIEKTQAELATQKEFYTNAINAAKEAEALAEARANNEARIELEGRLRETGEREATLVQALEELRQTLTRTEQQAVFREDMLRRDVDDLQKRYQASELRCEELIGQVPESTRPLLRQIEAMQETTARRAEAWAGVERALNSRLQEAEAKAAAAEERERSMNERLSQTLSRNAVLEAQVSCLRAEQAQLSRSLEKERQRASENRQEYLATQEAAATHEVRAKQLEDELKEFRSKHKHELRQEVTHRELLAQELEQERAARLELERAVHRETAAPTTKQIPYTENGNASIRKLYSAGSISSMEESYFLQASLDSSDGVFSERRLSGETTMTPYFLKSMTPNAFESTLRQKDGELASYTSRLMSLESIRDSLAEELVKITAECEKLRAEAGVLPSIQAELEALRRRHTAALELMGERDEELEELRADIVDMKEMYREQVDLLVDKLQRMSSSMLAT
ncbi:golgin candidate 5-like [Aristolochia californica]|uniref:golgin candidate 5-like n=1 Tax=Aristolochia californica TaxID=171875 RepID=UPI0035DFDB2A